MVKNRKRSSVLSEVNFENAAKRYKQAPKYETIQTHFDII